MLDKKQIEKIRLDIIIDKEVKEARMLISKLQDMFGFGW